MNKLEAVFRDVFDKPDLKIDGLTRSNFSEWDNLVHVKRIIAIEEEFNFKFTIDQVSNLRSVEELKRLLRVCAEITWTINRSLMKKIAVSLIAVNGTF